MGKSIMSLGGWLSLLMCALAIATMNGQVRSQDKLNFTLLETAVPIGAVCLDGSPPAYAYVEGSGNGSTNWIVYMEGGGWCVSQQDCLNRSRTYLGSSQPQYTDQRGVSFTGILDSYTEFNPYFYNWHKVYIHYCDGSVYMSDIDQVDPSNNLTFRGGRIYDAMMEEMLHKGMGHAHNAILTGGSAGGLSTILHCDRFRALFSNTTKVKCVSDSGFFIRGEGELANESGRHFAQVIATHELAALLPRSCTSKRDPNLCLFPEYLVGDIATPLFLVESAFDTVQISNNFIYTVRGGWGPTQWSNCFNDLAGCNSTQTGIIKDFGAIFIETLLKLNNSWSGGMFVDSCYLHTHILERYNWICSPSLHNKTMGQAIADWFFEGSSFRVIDSDNVLPQRCRAPDNAKICLAPSIS
ncbi:pectin acetylesterase 8-like isoform X2 [Salvia miltiorrhiza]|uniref:pectin acetylesterase 8-like isoform X2 n=1 Tax=Salvia miltiorrhiza TaxID=226208 RepID=UPI0025AC013E|nr:pectin acetylesterase 8-like isoform X2 [Salvia miltiorrhiza]